nr:DUF4175 family protein [Flavobacterium sp. 14A]
MVAENSNVIYKKLSSFIKKYYLNELLRGLIFFIGLGLLYFILTLFIEYFLWLQPVARTILFYLFVLVELCLFVRFILYPLFKLIKLRAGLSFKDAAAIIGSHFSDVNDSLINFLDLSNADLNTNQSELLAAAIDQRALQLQPIPFNNAVNFSYNKRYLPLAIIPLIGLFYLFFSNSTRDFSQSFNRIVHYNTAFSAPAAYQFVILNKSLQVEENKEFVLKVKTVGKVVPENAMIVLGDESYYLENDGPGQFHYTIANPAQNSKFQLVSSGIYSPEYVLDIIDVPAIVDLKMQLQFPSYLNRKPEVSVGSGNAAVPEGTRINWVINAKGTQNIDGVIDSKSFAFSKADNTFKASYTAIQDTDYQIITSNNNVKGYEKLNYHLKVLKDAYPEIRIEKIADSISNNKAYKLGTVSDDYGLSRLEVVYYPSAKPSNVKRGTIKKVGSNVDRFVFSFPGNLNVEKAVTYEYYFIVYDNDALHNYKSTKSEVFSSRVLSVKEEQNAMLQEQNQNVNGLENTLGKQQEQFKTLNHLDKIGKENSQFKFEEQQEINSFIERQKSQDEKMKKFAENIKENLDQVKSNKNDEFKKDLLEKVDENGDDLEKNKELLEELKDLNQKISNNELLDKLDKFKQNSKNQVKNLEQLVALTKKYYVEKKAEQIASNLKDLAQKQENLSNKGDSNSAKKQAEIKEEFNQLKKELTDLKKVNNELKSKSSIPQDAATEKMIDQDLSKAMDALSKDNKSGAKSNQNNAAKNMKSMAARLSKSLSSGEVIQLQEDVKMLRQVLDNLLAFSLSQESLLDRFKNLRSSSSAVSKNIKLQQDLKEQFKHIDDSLYTLSLRNPRLSIDVTKELGNIQYNVDKALDNFSESKLEKGQSHQQYTIAAANVLGDILSNILGNMQSSLAQSGEGNPQMGEGEGMQLPDIMKGQEAISDKIKKGGKASGSKENEGKGNKSEDGEGNAKDILDIYKEQRALRERLESELKKQGLSNNGSNAIDKMKQLEKQLLNKGFNQETIQKSNAIKSELLKLDTAVREQGEDNKRQSNSNSKNYKNEAVALPKAVLEYLNSIEILNRQSLPLRTNFDQKVQEYFKDKNDKF